MPEHGLEMRVHNFYKILGSKIERMRQTCPRCGDGVFLAEHEDRLSCGRCGYTKFKR